mgnify:CR=1 FL=1
MVRLRNRTGESVPAAAGTTSCTHSFITSIAGPEDRA